MKFKNQIMVIDDFIEKDYQNKIKTELLGGIDHTGLQFPWYYIEDVTVAFDDDSKHRPGLSHQYVNLPKEWLEDNDEPLKPNLLGRVHSEYHELFVPMLKTVGVKLGMRNINVLQGRSFLQFPIKERGEPDLPHIDIMDKIHIVGLYYVVDSDGDTVIYNERKESKTYLSLIHI